MEFFCPLCGTKRAVVTNPHLSAMNYLQISLITMLLTASLFPVMGFKGVFSLFFVWAAFESVLRLNFRKEVPCPHCGFDASWYKKDVKVARAKVDEFWKANSKVQPGHSSVLESSVKGDDSELLTGVASQGSEFEQYSERAFE